MTFSNDDPLVDNRAAFLLMCDCQVGEVLKAINYIALITVYRKSIVGSKSR